MSAKAEQIKVCRGCGKRPAKQLTLRWQTPNNDDIECRRCGVTVKNVYIWNKIMGDGNVRNNEMAAIIPQLVSKQKRMAADFKELTFKFDGLKYMLDTYQKKEAARVKRK